MVATASNNGYHDNGIEVRLSQPHSSTSFVQRLIGLSPRWLIAGALAIAALAIAGVVLHERGPTPGPVWMTVTLALSFDPLAVFVLRRIPGHPVGRLMLLTGIAATIATLAICWSALLPLAWLSQWMWWPPIAVIPLILLAFPEGRFDSRRLQILAFVLVVSASITTLSLLVGALTAPRTMLTTVGEFLPPFGRTMVQVAFAFIVVFLIATLAVLLTLVRRWKSSSTTGRRQLACLFPSAGLLVLGIGLDYFNVAGGWFLAVISLPLGLTYAILQYQLFDLDLFIYRGAVWLTLSCVAIGIYAISVVTVERIVAPSDSWTPNLVAGAAVAAGLMPIERFVQRALSHFLFGKRDDPYSVLIRVGRHIESITDPRDVLPKLTATLVETLRIPYAAISLRWADAAEPLLITHGRWISEPERFPMVAHGVDVGELLVATRRPGARFSHTEMRLLEGLAGQAGIAAEACRSTLALQRAREQLVLAREEERRRLRRDLHDGVASALTGARLLTAAARGELGETGRAPKLLDVLAEDLDSCSNEVRDLIDGLRPAALDEGLERALCGIIERIPATTLRVDLNVEGELMSLPAAIEVVAYRTIAEALNNVVKHAHASRSSVTLRRSEQALLLTVTDDGAGGEGTSSRPREEDHRFGVGISSIRSRVEEVAGEFDIQFTPAGTRVRAVLPTKAL